MNTIPAKTLLSSYGDNGWFGSNYTMNIYKGCCHGCIYCDSRSDCYRVENFDEVRIKEHALLLLEQELKSKRRKGTIMTGAMSDPYNPFEKDYELTKGALQLIGEYGFGVIINTKSPLVARDTQLLKSIAKNSPAAVNITITTAEDALCRKIERRVPVTSERLNAVKSLSKAGIPCGILLMPILPFINDTAENITNILRLAKDAGARWVYNGGADFMGVTLRQNQREYYLNALESTFPSLKEAYLREFGQAYFCNSPKAKELFEVFSSQCRKMGLAYKMESVVSLIYDDYRMEQLGLF